MPTAPLTPEDPRLTALACGEIDDPAQADALRAEIAADATLRTTFATLCTMQSMLQREFSREAEHARASLEESKEIITTTAQTFSREARAPTSRRRHQRGFTGATVRTPPILTSREKVGRFFFCTIFGTGLAAALVLAFQGISTTEKTALPANETAQTNSGETRLHLATTNSSGEENGMSPRRNGTNLPENPFRQAPAGGLAALVAKLPVLAANNAENAFQPAATHSAAHLCLVSAGRAYADQLHTSLQRGRLPERQLLRIDGLVNALLLAQSKPVAGVTLEVEIIPAPWADGHWLARATINAGAVDGTIAATRAEGTVTFDATQINAWRILGCEDGGKDAALLSLPGTIRSGERLTTLFEIIPNATNSTGRDLGTVKLVFQTPEGRTHEVSRAITYPHPGGLSAASDEMRFTAAIASFGLALRNSPHKGAATLSMANELAANLTHENKPLFTSLIKEAAPLVQ